MAYRGGGFGMGFGFALTPWVKRLLIANAAVFFATMAIEPLGFWLAMTPQLLLVRPWTPFTYMFVHGGVWHIVFNMLLLFFFGPPIEGRLGSDRFIRFYIMCGLGGALLSLLFAFNASVVGASGAVMGVMVAFALFWPESPIYIWGIFPIKAKWLVGALVMFDLWPAIIGLMSEGPAVGRSGIAHFAHLGGVAVAVLYIRWLRSKRWTGDTYRSGGSGGLSGLAGKLRGERRQPTPTGRAQVQRPRAQPRRREAEEKLLDEVDRVLDKISAQGIGSLSAEERELLDQVSRKYRTN